MFDRIRTVISQAVLRIKSDKAEIESLEARVGQLTQEEIEHHSLIGELTAREQAQALEISDLQRQLTEAIQEAEAVRDRNASLAQTRLEAIEELTAQVDQAKSLPTDTQLQALRQERDEAFDQVTALTESIRALDDEKAQTAAVIKSLEAVVNSAPQLPVGGGSCTSARKRKKK